MLGEMLAIEEIMYELNNFDHERNEKSGLPPGFRFHPTDEELITFYLASKVFNGSFCAPSIELAEVDLNRCEPWELPEMAKMGDKEWYFFNLRDRKYPTGLRTNRATTAGYWKATGKDREVYSSASTNGGTLLGMKKTLVFYKGRAPRGEKTKWVMHEYRLDGDFSYRQTCKEEWVICRIFHKMTEKKHQMVEADIGQLQSYNNMLLKNLSSPTLPPLLETSTTTTTSVVQNPFMIHHHHTYQEDLKSLITPLGVGGGGVSQCTLPNNGFEPSFSPIKSPIITTPTTNESSVIFNKSLIGLSHHQDCDNTTTISKQIYKKTDASFLQHTNCQVLSSTTDVNFMSSSWTDHHHENHHHQQHHIHNSLPLPSFGMMMMSDNCNGIRDHVNHEMSTSSAGIQRLLHAPIKLTTPDHSWLFDI